MSNGMNVFNVAQEVVQDLAQVRTVVEEKLDPRLIKEREQGGTKLSYIGGHTVIRLLNKAFGYKWSFEIVEDQIVPSLPKAVVEWNQQARRKLPVKNPDGSTKMEDQPPVVKVLGRLTVPGYGVKEQYGSKVLIGGATEQEAAFKSASTDALKKCATMFGIGLELYEDDDESTAETATTPNATPAPASTYSKPAPSTTPASTSWDNADIAQLKDNKGILGITDNGQLDPYVREFLDNKEATYKDISPANIKAFNIFLKKKAQEQ